MQQFVDTRDFLSQTKFYEGYSRFKDDEGRYESWDEAADRDWETNCCISFPLIFFDYLNLL